MVVAVFFHAPPCAYTPLQCVNSATSEVKWP